MLNLFDGDVVIVTGGGRGLGRAHALLLAELGARVVVNDLGGAADGTGADTGAAALVVQEIEAAGGSAVADVHDSSTAAGAAAVVAGALETYGRIDAAVANAGILRDGAFHKLSDADLLAVIDVHLGGTLRLFHAAYPVMRDQGYGRLVATTSAAGLFGNFGQVSYAAAKMGIVGLSRALAVEGAGRNIKVNVVAPAAVTRMTEGLIGRLAPVLDPAHVSPLVAYLCHPALEATGQVISAGGGRFARVAVGVGAGVSSEAPTADFVAESMDEILGEQDLRFIGSAAEELALMPAVAAAMQNGR